MNQILPFRTLGKSDLMITPIGLGCWQFSKQQNMAGKFWPKMEDDLIQQMVKISLEGGINWFDTAEIYGTGASEKALAASLAQGLVTGKFHDNPDLLKNIGMRKYSSAFKPAGLEKSRPLVKTVQELAIKYGVTSSQIALNWLITFHGETVVAIP